MRNAIGAFSSLTRILKAAVFTLVFTVLMLGGVLVAQDISVQTVEADLATDDQTAIEYGIHDNIVVQGGFNIEIMDTDSIPELLIPAHFNVVEGNSQIGQFDIIMPIFLGGEIEPGGNGQQVPIMPIRL